MTRSTTPWISCQLGAREHYSIPRALARAGRLDRLLTDIWKPSPILLRCLPGNIRRRLGERYHDGLDSAQVTAFTAPALWFEFRLRLRRNLGWQQISARNQWFDQQMVNWLTAQNWAGERRVVFAYSYAALGVFRFAKARGWRTVLGQIDPGPAHDRVVLDEKRSHPEVRTAWSPAPASYWQNWREECRLADRIVVNSSWSSEAIQSDGVEQAKIAVLPLRYEDPVAAPTRVYPKAFSSERPLRVLFLGSLGLGKGVARLLEAAHSLRGEPVDFHLVGDSDIENFAELIGHANVRRTSAVPRGAVTKFYREADVFLFPSLSDGFGLTQLEAQAHKLPLISSRHCGEVVRHGITGFLLPEVTAEEIAAAIRRLLENPTLLEEFSAQSTLPDSADLESAGDQLAALE